MRRVEGGGKEKVDDLGETEALFGEGLKYSLRGTLTVPSIRFSQVRCGGATSQGWLRGGTGTWWSFLEDPLS